DHVGAAVDGQRLGDLGAAGQVFGELLVVGDEPAEVDDAAHPGRRGGLGDGGRGPVVGGPETGLADAVHQVVHDVDRAVVGERVPGPLRVVGVQCDAVDPVSPAESLQADRVSGCGDDLVSLVQEGTDQPRADVAGGAGHQDPHVFHG